MISCCATPFLWCRSPHPPILDGCFGSSFPCHQWYKSFSLSDNWLIQRDKSMWAIHTQQLIKSVVWLNILLFLFLYLFQHMAATKMPARCLLVMLFCRLCQISTASVGSICSPSRVVRLVQTRAEKRRRNFKTVFS